MRWRGRITHLLLPLLFLIIFWFREAFFFLTNVKLILQYDYKLVVCRDMISQSLQIQNPELEVSKRMSSDFEEVIREGSINVRPGTTIFGARNFIQVRPPTYHSIYTHIYTVFTNSTLQGGYKENSLLNIYIQVHT